MGSKYAKLSDLMISDDFHDNSAIFQSTKQDTVFIFWGIIMDRRGYMDYKPYSIYMFFRDLPSGLLT